MISAECHSDDYAVQAEFDATPWFEKATREEIIALAKCGWGGDEPADNVAESFQQTNDQVNAMFVYLHMRRGTEPLGFECHVEPSHALIWLHTHRPSIAAQLEIEKLAD